MAAILIFLTSTLGRALMIGLAVIALLIGVRHAGYSAGVKHERVASAKAVAKVSAERDAFQASYNAQSASLKAANERVRLQGEADAKTLANSKGEVAVALKRQPKVDATIRRVTQKPTGPTLLDRYESVDKRVLEAIR